MLIPSIVGSAFICCLFIKKNRTKLGIWEWVSLFLIILTTAIWLASPDKTIAIVFGVCSQVVAGIPLTIECIKNPRPKYNLIGYILFVIACIIMLTMEGNAFKKFDLDNHLYPVFLGTQTLVEIGFLTFALFKKR